ncbi:MAG: hypothetical protein JNK48_02485 [Bryobacterales bacterium]|nr:hypothetical protein [Bryobacterales bacterium]
MHRLAAVTGITLLLAQAALILYSRATPARYFCWAPFDMQTDYELEVSVSGRKLTAAEVRNRYRRPMKGTDNRSVQNLIDILEGYEERYAGDEKATIVMRYRINGKEEREWVYRR